MVDRLRKNAHRQMRQTVTLLLAILSLLPVVGLAQDKADQTTDLLDRLEKETEGIYSEKDDTGFADDLTAMTYNNVQLVRKWKIVLEFAEYVGLDISLRKTEYMTNEEDEDKKFKWEGIEEIQGEAVKILGYWMERT